MEVVGTVTRMASVVAWVFLLPMAFIVAMLVITVISAIAEAISNYRKFKP